MKVYIISLADEEATTKLETLLKAIKDEGAEIEEIDRSKTLIVAVTDEEAEEEVEETSEHGVSEEPLM